MSLTAATAEIDDVLGRTNRPVGATLLAHFATPELVDAVAERVPVIEMFWAAPDVAFVRDGVIVGWQVGSVDEAKAAVDVGCQYVIAQGVEAGGHVRGTIPLHELIPRVREAVDVPVVAAGGIGTRADVARALALGRRRGESRHSVRRCCRVRGAPAVRRDAERGDGR